MKVDYLSEFGFRLSDYGKYSTIVLFLPPPPASPPPASRRSPRSVRPPVPVPPRRAERSGALSAPAAPPRLRRSRGRGAGAAGSAISPDAGPPPLPPHRNFCWGRAERGAGAAPGAVRCGAAGGSPPLSLCFFHLFYGSCSRARRRSRPRSPRPRRGEPGALLPPPVLPGSAAPAGRGSGARNGLAVRGCGGEVYGGFEMILRLYLL